MSLLGFARDLPDVCDLWKVFDKRARYTVDDMHDAYRLGYERALQAVRGTPPADPTKSTEKP